MVRRAKAAGLSKVTPSDRILQDFVAPRQGADEAWSSVTL